MCIVLQKPLGCIELSSDLGPPALLFTRKVYTVCGFLNLVRYCIKLKTVILRVVLDGCETWSPTSREEYRLRVFENRVLGRIFGPKRDEDGS